MEQEEMKGQCGQCSCQMEENSEDPEDLVLDISKMTAEERQAYLYRLLRSRSWGG
jgi:hypothetical protein